MTYPVEPRLADRQIDSSDGTAGEFAFSTAMTSKRIDPRREWLAQPRVLVMVPAYNEAASIASVLDDLRANYPWADVVVVNDGSHDATSNIARAGGAFVVDLPINLGIGGAVQTGLILALREHYDVALQFDGDGQHMAGQIGRLLEPLFEDRADAVIGSRFRGVSSYRVPRIRLAGIRSLNFVCSTLSGSRITDATSGFRAYNRAAIAALAQDYPQDYPEPEAIITLRKHHLRIDEVPVTMRERQGGRSSITPVRSGYYMAKVLLAVIIRSLGPVEAKL